MQTNTVASLRLRWLRSAIITLAFVMSAPLLLSAPKKPTTVWPDPSTGLMWAGLAYGGGLGDGQNFTQAQNYCASSNLAGLSGWRLPTAQEVMTATTIYTTPGSDDTGTKHTPSWVHTGPTFPRDPEDILVLDHGIKLEGHGAGIWTSTVADNKKNMVLLVGSAVSGFNLEDPGATFGKGALCTRTMEPDLLQLAKDAQVDHPVPDLLTLKAYVLIEKAKLAYQATQFQEVVAQGQAALQMEPKFAPAYQAIGIGYGMLGQWDLAVSNLQTAAKLDKSYKSTLKWAQAGQNAAKKGQQIDADSSVWK